MSYRIGRTTAVRGDVIEVSLIPLGKERDGQYHGVPDSMTVELPEGGAMVVGQPGSFLGIRLPNEAQLLGLVIGGRVEGVTEQDAEHPDAPSRLRVLEVLAVGTLEPSGKFDRGSDVLPTLGADVFALPSSILASIYGSDPNATLPIGKLSSLPEQDAFVNLNALLSRHAAIVGQTGAGKSWTVASVLQKIARFPKSTIILLDLHGEYGRAFGTYATYVSPSQLELPYWLMNAEELIDICVERHETGAPLQMSKFKELIQWARSINRDNAALGIPKITMDTPVYFDFARLLEELQRLDTELVLVNLARTHGPYYGIFTKTILRIQSRLSDRRFDLIFNPNMYTSSPSMESLFRQLLGEEAEPKQIVVLDLSQVPFDVRSAVISLVLRCLFDFTYWYRRKHGTAYPISVFCDEAHTYLNETEPTHRAARRMAERVAKEGRKYGMSLTVITQRPREVSSTILSQCNSFLCLRISNPDDQAYIRNLLPDSMRGIVGMISTLRRGEALVVGDATLMPTRIRVEPPEPKPQSSDVQFAELWGKPYQPVDIAGVLNLWRRESL